MSLKDERYERSIAERISPTPVEAMSGEPEEHGEALVSLDARKAVYDLADALGANDALGAEWLSSPALNYTRPSVEGEPMTCPACHEGGVHIPSSVPGDEGWQECSTCGGSGKLPTPEQIGELRDLLHREQGDLQATEYELQQYREHGAVEGEGAREALKRARNVAFTSTLTQENLVHHYVQAIDTFLASQAPAQEKNDG